MNSIGNSLLELRSLREDRIDWCWIRYALSGETFIRVFNQLLQALSISPCPFLFFLSDLRHFLLSRYSFLYLALAVLVMFKYCLPEVLTLTSWARDAPHLITHGRCLLVFGALV